METLGKASNLLHQFLFLFSIKKCLGCRELMSQRSNIKYREAIIKQNWSKLCKLENNFRNFSFLFFLYVHTRNQTCPQDTIALTSITISPLLYFLIILLAKLLALEYLYHNLHFPLLEFLVF